jgi:hypothetical protein
MKHLLLILVMLVCSFLIAPQVDATVLWEENFDSYNTNWYCGTNVGAVEEACTPPVKVGKSSSDYILYKAETKNWVGSNPSFISGIVPEAGREGRGWRINLRIVCATNYENILDAKNIGVDANPLYLRWYGRESWKDFKYSSYEKLFRIKDQNGSQIIIPEWMGNGYSQGFFRVWLNTGAVMDWTNFNLNTFTDSVATPDLRNKWMCYELKMDIVNNKYEFFVNGVSMGEKSASRALSTSKRIRYVTIGGNQNNVYCIGGTYPCWTPTNTFQTRDYDDIVLSTERVGCETAPPPPPPVPITPINETWYQDAKNWCDLNGWVIVEATAVPAKITPYNEVWYPEAKAWCDANEWEIVEVPSASPINETWYPEAKAWCDANGWVIVNP